VKAPLARRALRHVAGNLGTDRIIDRVEVAFLDAVAFAGLQEIAGRVDAKIADDIFGPAQTSGSPLEPILRCEDAVAAIGRFLAQEVGLLAEQPEALFHFP